MPLINGFEEKVLLKRLSEGDMTAFEILFRHYYPGLVIYTTNITANREQAEEIVQDFFFRLWDKRMDILLSGSLKSYGFQSVKNRALNVLRNKKVKDDYIKEIVQLSRDNLLYEEDLYVASELQARIESSMEKLPDKCREVFTMSRFKGKSNDEIAKELKISKRTVETHISKAIKTLKEELKDYIAILLFLSIL